MSPDEEEDALAWFREQTRGLADELLAERSDAPKHDSDFAKVNRFIADAWRDGECDLDRDAVLIIGDDAIAMHPQLHWVPTGDSNVMMQVVSREAAARILDDLGFHIEARAVRSGGLRGHIPTVYFVPDDESFALWAPYPYTPQGGVLTKGGAA